MVSTFFRQLVGNFIAMLFVVCILGAFILGFTGNLEPALNDLPKTIAPWFNAINPSPASKAVIVQRRDGDLTILPNGRIDVTETWQVQFIGGPFRTAFREIPYHRVNGITNWSVREADHAYTYSSNQTDYSFSETGANNASRATWYFPATTDQTRTFVLQYTLIGALRIYPDGDQFWWKFIEADRAYPIQASRVVLHLPTALSADQLKATTYLGINDAGNATIRDRQTIEFSGGPFAPQTEWEVRAQFPHGIVNVPVPSWQFAAEQEDSRANWRRIGELGQLFGAVLTVLGGIVGVIVTYLLRVQPYHVTPVAEYLAAPPDNLRPAAADVLLSEKADTRDVMATLVDLARRGIVRMGSLPNDDYLFERVQKDSAGLVAYEKNLLEIFFRGKTQRKLSSLTYKFSLALPELYDLMYREVVRAGNLLANPEKFKDGMKNLSAIIFWIGMLVTGALYLWTRNGGLALIDLGAIIVATALFGTLYTEAKVGKTRNGLVAAAKWQAFKNYLMHIEHYTQLQTAQDQFEKYLPYAIAFGIEKSYVHKFAEVDAPAPTWYGSTRHDERDWDDDSSHRHRPRAHTDSAPESEHTSSSASNLDNLARGSYTSLNSMSASFFTMLNSTADTLTSERPASSSSGSSSSSSWSGGSSGGSSSSGGGGGGGGSSGFG